MSKFTQPEETMIVKNAMELTATIMLEGNELRQIKAEKFQSLPNPPKRKVLSQPKSIAPKYPPMPKTTYSYTEFLRETVEDFKKYFLLVGIAAVIIFVLGSFTMGSVFVAMLIFALGFLALPMLIFTYYLYYTKRRTLNQQLAETPEYLQAIENAEREAERQQKEAEEIVRKEQQKLDAQYECVTLPEYQRALDMWNVVREKKIAFLEEEVRNNKEALGDLYDNSKLVSATYRELWILRWLYEDMSTSDHDMRYATELLDRDRQRLAVAEAGRRTEAAVHDMKETMMDGLYGVYHAIEYGNEIQEESVQILTKARRDVNIGNLAGIVQRHNVNKLLKK